MRDFCVTPSRTHVFLWLFDCSERQRKQLLFKGLPCLGGHGVLGVECSNHSVPTIFFNDLATFSVAFSFLSPMTFRVTLGFTVSPAGAPDFLPAFPPALQPTAFTSACTNIAWGE